MIFKNGSWTSEPVSPRRRMPWYRRSTLYRWLDARLLAGRDWNYLSARADFRLRGRRSNVWRSTEAALRMIHQYCRERGIDFAVVDIPSIKQLGGKRFSSDYDRSQRWLQEFCGQNNIPYVNLKDRYPKDHSSLFREGDSHWNEKGHAFIADFLKSWKFRKDQSS
jgi:hypothetical protein